ncbi:RHS repeat-associated core domain-containing protein [Sorangium sp. So ce448]|uniref:RHS repeat-associated core domain-containing protein n=1 Tax=Sorangium sp. So ce448 TaxID=3133314 RepID=UPI003F611C14
MPRTAPAPNIPAIPGMNPGVFILGGGGTGGGSGGRGGNGAGGDQGAGGKNGGNGAQGGGRNAGSCGQGSGGGCPNPTHGGGGGTHAGHPIDPVTGRVYTLAVTDMALPGAFPLVIERAYNSAQRDLDYGLGYGWNHSLGWRVIELRRRRVRVVTATALACEGRCPYEGETVKLPVGLLTRTRDGYLLKADDGITRVFEDVFAIDNEFRLSALLDHNGNQARLFYENGTGPLQLVNDSVGRLLRVRRHRDGRIAAFEVKNASSRGAWTSFRTYEYDERGDLVVARDALGHAMTFAYDADHRLVLERWPTGLEVQYRYDDRGRCVETWCNDPKEGALLAEGVPEVLADGSRAKGFLHAKVEYCGDENNVITSRALRRIGVNAFGKADRIVWAGQVHENVFDDAGELVGYRDGLRRIWRMGEADGAYRVVDPLAHVTDYRYDDRGNVVTTRGPEGLETQHARDPNGNLIYLSDAIGLVASFRYDERGCLVHAETADGGKTAMTYDALCNRVGIVEPDGGARALRYDFLGRLVEMRDEKGGVHRWIYDAMGRVVEHRSPLGARTVTNYDEAGRFAGERDADGRWFRLIYAGLREVIAVERSDGTRVSYAYDRELDMVRIVNEEGDVHTIERDLEGRILSERTFDGRWLRYRNDQAGRLSRITFDDGEFVELAYDDLDRLIARTFSDDTSHKLEYDERGRLLSFETEAVCTLYTYDERGRCIREDTERKDDPSSATSLRHVYDAGLHRTKVEALGAFSISAPRDTAGRCAALVFSDLSGTRGADQPIARFAYDPTDGETGRFFAGGGRIELTRDAHGNVLRSAVFGGGTAVIRPGEPMWVGGLAGPETLRFDYRWSPADELQVLADRDRGAQSFLYDARGRIAQKQHEGRARTEDYVLSPRGDVQWIDGRAQSHLSGGRLVTTNGAALTYDARGRLVKKVEGTVVTTYAWSALGLLSGMTLPDGTRLEFVYDGFARRIEKRLLRRDTAMVRHRYRWDGEDLLEETVERQASATGAPAAFTLVERRRYAYSPGSPAPVAQAIDTEAGPGAWKYFVHRDGAPVPLGLVNADGNVDQVFETDAYGRVIAGDAAATLVRFPGHWYEPETGLHYNRWRYFDPASATYLSPEPLGLEGGLEAYGYVSGRPLALVDADGLMRSTVTSRRGAGPTQTGYSARDPRTPLTEPGSDEPYQRQLHPAVAAALPVRNAMPRAAGGCSEPDAVSRYLQDYERRNGVSCDPGTPQGQRHLRRALRRMGSIGSNDSDPNQTACAPCPNCSQMLARLHAMAGVGQSPPVVPASPPPPRNAPPGTPLPPPTAARAALANTQLRNDINSGNLADANRANTSRYAEVLDQQVAAGQMSRAERDRRVRRVSGMTPGTYDYVNGQWQQL